LPTRYELAITAFVDELAQCQPTQCQPTHCHNPYHDPDLSHNLKQYLIALKKHLGKRKTAAPTTPGKLTIPIKSQKLLLVGEALGYRGGKLTGIPFSSGRMINTSNTAFWQTLRPKLIVKDNVAESTATIIWQYFSEREIIPVMWNAFPFHPYCEDNPESNRAPNRDELAIGRVFLTQIQQIFKPDSIVAVGNHGFKTAQAAFGSKKVRLVRHPSFGGKQEFCQQMDAILAERQ